MAVCHTQKESCHSHMALACGRGSRVLRGGCSVLQCVAVCVAVCVAHVALVCGRGWIMAVWYTYEDV